MKKFLFFLLIFGLLLICTSCDNTLSPSSSPSSSRSQSSQSYSTSSLPPIEPHPSISYSFYTPTAQAFRIYYSLHLQSNPSVGYDWGSTVTYDGKAISNGETITGVYGSYINIKAHITEYDNVPDSGSGSLTLCLKDGESDSIMIYVRENRGKYSGNTATWKLTCKIESQ